MTAAAAKPLPRLRAGMGLQLMFDRAALHLLRQGRRSDGLVGSTVGCLYRGDEGRACAVGCLLPGRLVSARLENKRVAALLEGGPRTAVGRAGAYLARLAGLPAADGRVLRLLSDLQCVHDMREPAEWREGLREAARRSGLSDAVLGGEG